MLKCNKQWQAREWDPIRSAQGKQEPITPDNNNNNKNRKIMREENKTDFAS